MEPKTLVIDRFNGRITRFRNGDINSGMSPEYFGNTPWGYDALQQSGLLMFDQAAYSIAGSVITDLVVAGRVRVESGISYLYAVGHTGRVYKIQINNPATNNPDYDNPVLLTTLTASQTFKYGSSIQFYTLSGTEYMFIGWDNGVTRLNFNGTGETQVSATVDSTHWIAGVPRQSVQFLGSMFFTNGANLAQIDTTGVVITWQKLNPGFPTNMTARDVDLTSDGRYLVTAVTRSVPGDLTAIAPDTNIITATESLLVYWNGTDTAASSLTSYSFPVGTYCTFGNFEYIFAEQIGGATLATPSGVVGVLQYESLPYANAVSSSGDFLSWASTRLVGTHTQGVLNLYGSVDTENPVGFYKQLMIASTLSSGDVIRIPFYAPVSSWQSAGSGAGYTNTPYQLFGTGKSYFSTLEYNGSTTTYGFYAFKNIIDYQNTASTGNYQTQTQLFSKQIKPTEVRVYMETFTSSTSFTVALIGIGGTVLTGGSKTFTSTDQAYSACKFTPQVGQTPALGVRITNVGSVTPVINKVEVDISAYGD